MPCLLSFNLLLAALCYLPILVVSLKSSSKSWVAKKGLKLAKRSSRLSFRSQHLVTLDPEMPIGRRHSPSTLSKSAKSQVLTLRAGFNPYVQDMAVSSMVLGETLVWLKIWTTLATRGILDSKLTRKIIHSTCVPLFILHWPLYSQSPSACLFASAIPLAQMLRLYLAGSSKISERSSSSNNSSNENSPSSSRDSDLVAAVSRTGSREEALGGPFIYAIVLFLATLFFFRSSSVGIVAVCQMAAGDGLADIIGRRYGAVKWPFCKSKSIAGSLAFVLGGCAVSFLSLYWMQTTGYLEYDTMDYVGNLLVISLLSATIELLPIVDDNISVPVAAALLTYFLLPH